MALRAPPRIPPRVLPRVPGVDCSATPSGDDGGGAVPPPWSPSQLPAVTLWLNATHSSLALATLTCADQSGNGFDCSVAATGITIVGAASGSPTRLVFPGSGNQSIAGPSLPNPGTETTLLILRRCPLSTTQCQWFNASTSNSYDLFHDRNGAPGRTGVFVGTATLINPDNGTAWQIDTVRTSGGVADLYQGAALVQSHAIVTPGTTTGGYTFGGSIFGVDDAREIAELIYCYAALSPADLANAWAYLLGTIPP